MNIITAQRSTARARSSGPAGRRATGRSTLYTISTGLTQQITSNSYNDDFARLNAGGQVLWRAYEPADSEIFLYDPGTGLTTNISNNDIPDPHGRFNDRGQVVWSGGAEGSRQIYLYQAGVTTISATTPPTTSTRSSTTPAWSCGPASTAPPTRSTLMWTASPKDYLRGRGQNSRP